MFFKIEKIKSGYCIAMARYKNDFTPYWLVSTIIEHLEVEANSFDKMVKKYNGSYLKLNFYDNRSYCEIHYIDDLYVRTYFNNEKDAKLFIAEYLEPRLMIKSLL